MIKTNILLLVLILTVVFAPAVIAQQKETDNKASVTTAGQSNSSDEQNDRLLYIGFGVVIGFILSGSISYLIRSRRGLGTEYDKFGAFGTPIHIKPEDKLINKHGTLKPPDLQNHENRFM